MINCSNEMRKDNSAASLKGRAEGNNLMDEQLKVYKLSYDQAACDNHEISKEDLKRIKKQITSRNIY